MNSQLLTTLKRLKEEFEDLISNPLSEIGVTVQLLNENDYFEWGITIIGPKDTPYKDGIFYLKANFKDNYPYERPNIYFITPIYHVDVNPNKIKFFDSEPLGFPALNNLFWWKPEFKMRDILSDLHKLFYNHSCEHPYGLERNDECRNNKGLYYKKIEYFTKKYANKQQKSNFIPLEKNWDFSDENK